MVVKNGGATTAFCGGLDIAYMRTPAYWTAPNYQWLWHDIHAQLEGFIARDLEREFVLRWNREKDSSVVPRQAGWQPFENLVQTSAGTVDQKPGNNTQKLQLLRTVSVQGIGRSIQTTKRDDIWQGYLRLIGCATRLLYMENQYYREPRMAEAIVKQAKAQPELIVIIVVPEQLDDPDDPIKRHGNWLQHEFFRRLLAGIPSNRLRVYTMFHRIIHSKLIMVDDHTLSVGSANANPRGFFLDTELNVVLDDAETVKSFRHRLWSHDLGILESTVATWAAPDFTARWDAVAKADQRLTKTPDEMTGEGVIPFDPLREKGVKQLFIHDVLTEYPDADDGHVSGGSNFTWTAIKTEAPGARRNAPFNYHEEPFDFEWETTGSVDPFFPAKPAGSAGSPSLLPIPLFPPKPADPLTADPKMKQALTNAIGKLEKDRKLAPGTFPVRFTLVDVTNASGSFPSAGHLETETDYIASEAKVAVMYSAYALRDMVRRFAASSGANSANLFAQLCQADEPVNCQGLQEHRPFSPHG